MSECSVKLNSYYTNVLNELGISDDNPMHSIFSTLAEILALILNQVKAFLNGTGLLILRLVNYAKRIITEWKIPKKIRIAVQALQDIVQSVVEVFTIPEQFGAVPQQIMDTFTPLLQVLGSSSVNLYQLASNVLDATFFGDLVFKPIFSNITLPTFPGMNIPDVNTFDIINPAIQLLTSTILAPFAMIKAILEPFKPIWNFVKALASGSPMRLVRAVGRIPSILSKLVSFLLSIKSAFSSPFPTGVLNLIEPLLQQLLSPVISSSYGLTEIGISDIVNNVFNMLTQLFTQGPNGIIETLKNSSASPPNPAIGLVTPVYAFLQGSIVGTVDCLFGPILEIIGFSMTFAGGYVLASTGELNTPEFSQGELFIAGFDDAFYQRSAWMNEFGFYANGERTDILFPDREYDWETILREYGIHYITEDF